MSELASFRDYEPKHIPDELLDRIEREVEILVWGMDDPDLKLEVMRRGYQYLLQRLQATRYNEMAPEHRKVWPKNQDEQNDIIWVQDRLST